MIPMLGYRSATTQKFWGVDETNTGGVLGVLVNGAATSGPTLSAATDYTGIVTATVPSTAYTYQLTINGVAATPAYQSPAKPGASDYTKIVFWGDANGNSPGFYRASQEGAHLGVCLGDWDYADTVIAGSTVLATHRAQHRSVIVNELNRQVLLRALPHVSMWDNHEGVGSTGASPGDALYDAAFQACNEYFLSLNPTNTDAGIHSLAYQTPYFRFTFGGIDFVCMDHISWATDRNTVAANKMDATELAWVNAALTASTSPILVICSPTQPYDNTEWASLRTTIDGLNKTVVLLTADAHGAASIWRQPQPSGHASWFPTRGLYECQATPMMHPTCTAGDPITSAFSQQHFIDVSANTNTLGCNYNYGTLEYFPSGSTEYATAHVKISIKSAWDGKTRHCVHIPQGQRAPVFASRGGGML